MSPATTDWTTETPTEPGKYLVERVGDWFPKGDINNISHYVVDVMETTSGEMMVLYGGQFLTFSDYEGSYWAKINTAN